MEDTGCSADVRHSEGRMTWPNFQLTERGEFDWEP